MISSGSYRIDLSALSAMILRCKIRENTRLSDSPTHFSVHELHSRILDYALIPEPADCNSELKALILKAFPEYRTGNFWKNQAPAFRNSSPPDPLQLLAVEYLQSNESRFNWAYRLHPLLLSTRHYSPLKVYTCVRAVYVTITDIDPILDDKKEKILEKIENALRALGLPNDVGTRFLADLLQNSEHLKEWEPTVFPLIDLHTLKNKHKRKFSMDGDLISTAIAEIFFVPRGTEKYTEIYSRLNSWFNEELDLSEAYSICLEVLPLPAVNRIEIKNARKPIDTL